VASVSKPARVDVLKAAQAIWPWLRDFVLNDSELSWAEVVADPNHWHLREITEEMAKAALEAIPCWGCMS
jgi:hypothetical protein